MLHTLTWFVLRTEPWEVFHRKSDKQDTYGISSVLASSGPSTVCAGDLASFFPMFSDSKSSPSPYRDILPAPSFPRHARHQDKPPA
ncbi:hypothetical protein RRG08_043512 [Elysia crispata]|uniref:Uncharacterized protein n=1 Tax=Elysia crispata TaxID=231223 RepID=A0AAE0YFM1_9GAST|nr:hypothetical protein RRG08_043512 [Elysia crispata]